MVKSKKVGRSRRASGGKKCGIGELFKKLAEIAAGDVIFGARTFKKVPIAFFGKR